LNKWEHCGRHFWIEAGKNCPLLSSLTQATSAYLLTVTGRQPVGKWWRPQP